MIQNQPQYKIEYRTCKEHNHQTQKTNLVCLNKSCLENSLICSFCVQEKHKGHQTKPLKHFLAILQKKYRSEKQSTVHFDLDELEQQKYQILNQIKLSVQKLANKFMALEQEVVNKYQLIRTQILQREMKKKNFSKFYEAMAIQGRGDPKFQIINYLHFDPLYSFNMSNKDLQQFMGLSQKYFSQIHKNILALKKDHLQIGVPALQQAVINVSQKKEQQFIFSKVIKKVDNTFTQTSSNTKQTVGYFNWKLKDFKGKMKINVKTMQFGSKLTFGAAKLSVLQKSKFTIPQPGALGVLWLDSIGKHQGANYNHIHSITSGQSMDITVRKNHMKISSKSSICDFILPDKQETVFFWNMEGQCSIEMLYTPIKN